MQAYKSKNNKKPGHAPKLSFLIGRQGVVFQPSTFGDARGTEPASFAKSFNMGKKKKG